MVVGTVGGGSKQKLRWVDPERPPLADGSPRRERVLQLVYDALRTCTVAVVAHGEHVRYVIAHEVRRRAWRSGVRGEALVDD